APWKWSLAEIGPIFAAITGSKRMHKTDGPIVNIGIPIPAWLQERPWHTLSAAEALSAAGSSEAGLSEAEAARRLAIAGENLLPQKPPIPLWRIALRQFKSPLVYVLAAAAVVSLSLGHLGDAGFIGFVLAVNAAIGSFQEKKADNGSRALQKLLRVRANVL